MIYRIWAWVRDHAVFLFSALAAICAWFVYRGKHNVSVALAKEKEVLLAKEQARVLAAEKGAATATVEIKAAYQEKLRQIDIEQAKQIQSLESNPEALVEAILRATLALLLALYPFDLRADDDLIDVPIPEYSTTMTCVKADPKKCSMVLEKGVLAPFQGILSTFRTAAEQTAKASFNEERIRAEAASRIQLVEAEAEKNKGIFEAKLETKDNEIDALKHQLDEAGAIYRNPFIVVPATVVVTCLLGWGAIEAAQKLRK